MKKLLSLALAVVMTFALSGCEKPAAPTLFKIDQQYASHLSHTEESFTVKLDLSDPTALDGTTVYDGEYGQIKLYGVTNITPFGCDLTFTTHGILEKDHAELIAATLPDFENDLLVMKTAALSVSPEEHFTLVYDALSPEFGASGNAFRLHLNIKDPKVADTPEALSCEIKVSNLLLMTWGGEKGNA